MNTPNSDRIVEAHVPVLLDEPTNLLRREVLPHIRQLERGNQLRWFSFLLHPLTAITGDSAAQGFGIRLRLEPADHLDPDRFLSGLPPSFRQPHRVDLHGPIGGVKEEQLNGGDVVHAWRMIGESSEWVLSLLETHADSLTPEQIFQFLHYITNPLGLGNQCFWAPGLHRF